MRMCRTGLPLWRILRRPYGRPVEALYLERDTVGSAVGGRNESKMRCSGNQDCSTWNIYVLRCGPGGDFMQISQVEPSANTSKICRRAPMDMERPLDKTVTGLSLQDTAEPTRF